jgi:hypothetical protein
VFALADGINVIVGIRIIRHLQIPSTGIEIETRRGKNFRSLVPLPRLPSMYAFIDPWCQLIDMYACKGAGQERGASACKLHVHVQLNQWRYMANGSSRQVDRLDTGPRITREGVR